MKTTKFAGVEMTVDMCCALDALVEAGCDGVSFCGEWFVAGASDLAGNDLASGDWRVGYGATDLGLAAWEAGARDVASRERARFENDGE